MPEIMLVNPRKRGAKQSETKKHKTTRKAGQFKRNPISDRKKSRRARHHPVGGGLDLLVPAAVGAATAVAADVGLGLMPSLPSALTYGVGRQVARAGVVVGLSVLVGRALGKGVGRRMMAGGLTVIAYDGLKKLTAQVAPSLNLSGVDDYPAISWGQGMGEPIDVPLSGAPEFTNGYSRY